MRILMVCPELPSADNPGSMAPTARQIESIRQQGVDVDVIDMRGIPKLKYLQSIPRIRRLAARADLVHAHFGYCGWLAHLAQRKPVVLSFMGDDLLGTRKDDGSLEWFSRVMVQANKRLASRVSRVIVKSQVMASIIAPVASSVVPNGVDTESFQPRERGFARQRLGMGDGLKVLFPGDPKNPGKGWTMAADAIRGAIEMTGQEIELVPLWGVQPDDVPLYMSACNAMVMTSMSEGSPNVVKEALACNTPVVGVPVGDVQEMLEGIEGCSFCERDSREIARNLIALFSIGRSWGRDAILSRGLDLASVAQRVIKIYSTVLDTKSAEGRSECVERGSPCVE